jgi:hypothetical protein
MIDASALPEGRAVYCHDPGCAAAGTGADRTCTPTIRYELPYREIVATRSLNPEVARAFVDATRSREQLLMDIAARRLAGEPTLSARSLGGKARAASLTPQQRSEIASKAARARWQKGGSSDVIP